MAMHEMFQYSPFNIIMSWRDTMGSLAALSACFADGMWFSVWCPKRAEPFSVIKYQEGPTACDPCCLRCTTWSSFPFKSSLNRVLITACEHRHLLLDEEQSKPKETCLSSDEVGEPVGHQKGPCGDVPWVTLICLAPEVAACPLLFGRGRKKLKEGHAFQWLSHGGCCVGHKPSF